MKRRMKKVTAFLLTLVMIIGILPIMPLQSSAATSNIQAKIDLIKTVYPSGSYFTSHGGSHNMFDYSVCPDRGDGMPYASCACSLSSQTKKVSGLYSGAEVASKLGITVWQCCAFAHYVFYNIFGINFNSCGTVSVNNAQLGDAVLFDFDGVDHYAICLYTSGSNIVVYDANADYCGKVSYGSTYSKSNVVTVYHANNYDSVGGTSYTYQSITTGTYYLKNKATGEYLIVDAGADVNQQNISVWPWAKCNEEKFSITKASDGYKMRPLCSSARLVNAWGTSPSSGANVNLYDDCSESSQWWKFESVSSGYIIHNSYAPSCVLTADGRNVCIQSRTGNDNQIWILQSEAVAEAANGAHTCNKAGGFQYYWATHPHYNCYKCSICGKIWEDRSETNVLTSCSSCSHTHSYTAMTEVVKAATCTDYGSQKKYCSCGEYVTETIPKKSHSYPADAKTLVKKASCGGTGLYRTACANGCGTVKEEIVSALGHDYRPTVSYADCSVGSKIVYTCSRCYDSYDVTSASGVSPEWSETKPDGIPDDMIETKIQYRYKTKEITTSTSSSLSGWTKLDSKTTYSSWTNKGWTRTKPTESDTLRITDTKTVTDSAAYTSYHYERWTNGSWTFYYDPGNSSYWYEDITLDYRLNPIWDADNGLYRYGSYGTYLTTCWWNESSAYHAAVTHTEWYYQTRTKTVTNTFYKWGSFSDWQDNAVTANDNTQVETRTLYRYKLTEALGHDIVHHSAKAATCISSGWKEYDTCSRCSYSTYQATPKTSHSYTVTKVEPTAVSQGYTLHTCMVCSSSYKDNYVDKISDNRAKLIIESKKAAEGSRVTVDLRIENNPGFVSLSAAVFYDKNCLTLVNIENKLADFTMTAENVIVWDSDEVYKEDGIIATFTFDVAEGKAGTDCELLVTSMGASDESFNDFELIAYSGVIRIESFVRGDVNGDGKITTADLAMLRKYLANKDPITGESTLTVGEGADITGDGKVTTADLAKLRKYLANRDPVTGESSVILGSI